jgi:uncharacterized protein (DUF1697 family)
MPRFVVLLRGVNVGKGNRLPMADFRKLLEGLGYEAVTTLLNSGNAAFSSPGRSAARHAAGISAAIGQRFGFTVLTIVKAAAEIAAIVKASPIAPPDDGHSRFFVAFAPDKAGLQGLRALQPLANGPEKLVITDDAAYVHCPDGLLKSKLGEALLGKGGRGVTTRNWATVLKLAELAKA